MSTPILVHELKVWPEFFDPLDRNEKTFEARRNDRGFKVGDILHLREFVPAGFEPHILTGNYQQDVMPPEVRAERYTGRECWRKITYILHGGVNAPFGVVDEHVILGLAVLLPSRDLLYIDVSTSDRIVRQFVPFAFITVGADGIRRVEVP